MWERRKRFATRSFEHVNVVGEGDAAISSDAPEEGHLALRVRGDEQRVGGLVEEHEGVGAGELREHEAGRVWRPVAERLVGLDDEEHLVGALGQPVLLAQPPQVVQHPLEQAEHLVFRRERPGCMVKHKTNNVTLAPAVSVMLSLLVKLITSKP